MRMVTFLLIALGVLLGAYVLIFAVLYLQQDSMVFFPQRTEEAAMSQEARAAGFRQWKSTQGESVGWISEDGDPKKLLMLFHGNGGHAGHDFHFRKLLRDQGCDWTVCLVEYPGYGLREGTPSEASLTNAALEAFDALAKDPETVIYLMGESLGSGVVSAVAGARPNRVAGLILVVPFDSLVSAAQCKYPWLPVGTLLRTRFDSLSALRSYHGPSAVIVGENDTVVPARLGQRLYESLQGNKRLWIVPQTGHNVMGFLETHWRDIHNHLEPPTP